MNCVQKNKLDYIVNMSSRNAYLSKLLFAQSLEQFDFPYRGMRYLFFTPKKGQRHYGSVAKQSHVIVDYRPLFENYNNLLDSVMFLSTRAI